jgi:phosphatidylserine/phosphatidylglycerophosphate/cardiolipin synthase-like enzyme
VTRVIIEPDDGIAPVVALIAAASATILLKMFTFDSPALIAALAEAVARGVGVRVMLNPQRSSGSRANDATAAALRDAGVAVRWTSPHFAVTHEKSMVIDSRLALIATFNYVDKYFTATRDYGIVTEEAEAVRQVIDCFEADWNEQVYTLPPGSPLMLSNSNARHAMAAFIDEARKTLHVQHPKYSDMAILDRLLAAHERGVKVNVLCGGRHGISPSDMMDTFSALRALARAGVKIRRQHKLRLHAKLLVADHSRALLGSMNIDRSAFDLRREMGAEITEPAAVARLDNRFHLDWDAAKPYEAPDPMALDIVTAVDHQAASGGSGGANGGGSGGSGGGSESSDEVSHADSHDPDLAHE